MGPGVWALRHDADHGAEGLHDLATVSIDVLWVEARRSCGRVGSEGKDGVLDELQSSHSVCPTEDVGGGLESP